jgi:hypothetical protein
MLLSVDDMIIKAEKLAADLEEAGSGPSTPVALSHFWHEVTGLSHSYMSNTGKPVPELSCTLGLIDAAIAQPDTPQGPLNRATQLLTRFANTLRHSSSPSLSPQNSQEVVV